MDTTAQLKRVGRPAVPKHCEVGGQGAGVLDDQLLGFRVLGAHDCVSTYGCTYVCMLHTHINTPMRVHVCMYLHTYMYIYMYRYARTCLHAEIYI